MKMIGQNDMHSNTFYFLIICLLGLFEPTLLPAMVNSNHTTSSVLFATDDILEFTISGPLRTLFKDRSGEPSYHPITLSYFLEDSTKISIELKARTRGNFRRDATNCFLPP